MSKMPLDVISCFLGILIKIKRFVS